MAARFPLTSLARSTAPHVGTPVQTLYTNQLLIGLKGRLNADASLKISALRPATALQKYKEIQNSNDPDFANQVLAHFGIKPKVDSRTSIFIGGDDKTKVHGQDTICNQVLRRGERTGKMLG